MFELALREVHKNARDMLDLDEVEVARAEALKEDLKYTVFEYPLDMLDKIIKFFIPSRFS
ncbi:MAG: hypothetical protein Q9M91_06355 [Candidatus Dojkabacteria bacterium]|nr:hypothetical protein [Candidatus Dojkabacteria bacterium]